MDGKPDKSESVRLYYALAGAMLLAVIVATAFAHYQNSREYKMPPPAGCTWSWHIDGGSVTATDNTASVVCHGQRCTVTAVCR